MVLPPMNSRTRASPGIKLRSFTLPATDGEEITEVSLREKLGKGKVLLAFFPLAFSPVCTQ